jgi:hypothetical protein
MKLSRKSGQLMLFFSDNNYITFLNHSSKTTSIFKELYGDILDAYNFLLFLKEKREIYYNLKIKKIVTASQITKPSNFNSNSFPDLVRKYIDETTMCELCYTFSLFERDIKIYFFTEEDDIELKLDIYNKHVDNIVLWLYILNQYASKRCSVTLSIYFYFTSLEKHLPNSNIVELDEINVNTAFTTTCPKDSEIVVFRKEEWFKVFIHETFHNFGLDFSDMNNDSIHKCILDIFNVNSEVNLYESYTEFWAEIMNALCCSFLALKDKSDYDEFLSHIYFFLNYERVYSFFQLVKTLNFMGLQYSDLYSKTERSKLLRENLYKEKTNVLSYYVIKAILMNNYPSFLSWCKTNNLSLLPFKKTISNQQEYCNFIQKNYKTKTMLGNIYDTQTFLNRIGKKKNKQNMKYLLSNLRMSICEFG